MVSLYNALQDVEYDMPQLNDNAVREWCKIEKDFRQLAIGKIIWLARRYGFDSWNSQHVKAVMIPLIDALRTDGHVDIGDGSMTPLDGAIEQQYQEQIKRTRTHIRNGSKIKEWHTAEFRGSGETILGNIIDAYDALPPGRYEMHFGFKLIDESGEVE
jgi:hypothetical protein